jgi:predicted DNA-binding protein
MALHRAQILLEDHQHERLETLARDSGRSMSDLVREAVAAFLSHTSEEESVRRSLEAINELTGLRRRVEAKKGCLQPSFLGQLREERDAGLLP